MKWISVTLISLGLVACSGDGAGGSGGKSGAAAQACSDFVKNKLEGKQFTLDLPALAASLKDTAGNSGTLTAPIIIEPGLTTEVKQSLKCDVRFGAEDKPEVLNVTFIW
ncbi:MAG: hypothetical protein ABIP02_09250 [Arenimonas sp.]